MNNNAPELRFPEFESRWKLSPIKSLLTRASEPVEVEPTETYRQIGVRSHGKGVFHKEAVLGVELGAKRIFHVVPNALVLNIVFAWEQAIALTSVTDAGFVASHRFPMFLEKDRKSYLPFLRYFFLTRRGKALLEIASPGGAGRNKTLGQDAFLKLKATVPGQVEQQKIANFLDAISQKISILKAKKEAIEAHKRGMMQVLFSQSIRFKGDDGKRFSEWTEQKLGDHLTQVVTRARADTVIPVYSSSRVGLKRQEDYFADRRLANEGSYGVVPSMHITYRHMSDDLTFKFNLNSLGFDIAVSKEYPVFTTIGMNIQFLLYWLNNSDDFRRFAIMQKKGGTRTRLYLKSLQNWTVTLPSIEEQNKIADFLVAIDVKIDTVSTQIVQMETFKKGLLQKLFV